MKQSGTIIVILLCMTLLWVSSGPACTHHTATPEKTGILLVTFGSTYPEAQNAFDNIDENVRNAFPGKEIRWAYTSRIVRNRMAEKGEILDSPEQALAKMADEAFTRVAVQSLHVIPGSEYHYLVSTARAFESLKKGIGRISVGKPLLAGQKALEAAAGAVNATMPEKRKPDEAVVLVGHGSSHAADASYAALMWQLQQEDENIFIGTISGFPGIDEIVSLLEENNPEKVWLMPFMSVLGDHAQNDMFGADAGSWRIVLTEAGFTVEGVNKGFAEYDEYVDIWIRHLREALSRI